MLTIKKIINNKIWISSTLALVLILFVIPLLVISLNFSTSKVPEGVFIKTGNRIFYNFLKKIKQEDGILVLGTSETGNFMKGNNYYSLLNQDKEFDKSVYALGGAGRSANVYFPLILDNPEVFNGLEIIYYINPIYWRVGLNNFKPAYFNRYIDPNLVASVKKIAQEEHVFNDFMLVNTNEVIYFPFFLSRQIDNFKSIYYHDLNQILESKGEGSYKTKTSLNKYYNKKDVERLKNEINLDYNVTNEFLEKNINSPIIDTNSTYQHDMLLGFIRLTQKYNIDCKFYLGPYNEIYCQRKNPELLKDYQKVMVDIKELLKTNDIDFIDGSSLSNVSGTFSDVQHISKYGAYLTTLQIKEYYEKNN